MFKDYDKLLSKYMRAGEHGVGLDLTLVSDISLFFDIQVSKKESVLPFSCTANNSLDSLQEGISKIL